MTTPFMTPEEIAFLEENLKPTDHVWEWGSGGSTPWLSRRVRRVTTVEHQRFHALRAIESVGSNVSVIYAPPDLPYTEGGEDDGDLETFRRYVEAYTGRDVNAVLIDGRARVWCARQVAENGMYGPNPDARIFLHDAGRAAYARIWQDDQQWGRAHLRPVKQVGALLLLEPWAVAPSIPAIPSAVTFL